VNLGSVEAKKIIFNINNATMDKYTRFKFQILIGAVIIAGSIFLVFRYLMKGSPFIKVLALGLIVGVSYLVVDYLIKKSKQLKENE
jgi:hypothetical protein